MVIVATLMIMIMTVIVTARAAGIASGSEIMAAPIGGHDRRTQAHLFGSKFPVQATVLRRLARRCDLSLVHLQRLDLGVHSGGWGGVFDAPGSFWPTPRGILLQPARGEFHRSIEA
jgi:hypothetical protein